MALPSLDERVEPAFRRRGMHVDNCYPNQTMWSLEDWKKTIDQMAKMRMNYLQVFWFPNTPWLTYEYRGEKNFLGDASTKESGYMLWSAEQGSFLVKDMTVGREHFKYPRIAPPELQDVETPDQAFQKSQDLLRAVIAYAKTRKIKTWLAIDPVSVPPNLGRFARNRAGDLPFQPILGGAYMCPADPVAHEINESRLKSLFATYPEAEGYFLWFPELYPNCDDDKEPCVHVAGTAQVLRQRDAALDGLCQWLREKRRSRGGFRRGHRRTDAECVGGARSHQSPGKGRNRRLRPRLRLSAHRQDCSPKTCLLPT